MAVLMLHYSHWLTADFVLMSLKVYKECKASLSESLHGQIQMRMDGTLHADVCRDVKKHMEMNVGSKNKHLECLLRWVLFIFVRH